MESHSRTAVTKSSVLWWVYLYGNHCSYMPLLCTSPGTPAVPGSAYLNFATAEDASRPNSCAFYSGLAWSSGDCTAPRDYVCQIRRVRHSLVQEPELPLCGVRRRQGVLGKTGRGLFPSLHLPPIAHRPPLAGTGDRDAAQFGEITWQVGAIEGGRKIAGS